MESVKDFIQGLDTILTQYLNSALIDTIALFKVQRYHQVAHNIFISLGITVFTNKPTG